MKNKEFNKEDYCDYCVHLTLNHYDLICGCSLLIWWNEPRIGRKGEGIGFIKPNECSKWKLEP